MNADGHNALLVVSQKAYQWHEPCVAGGEKSSNLFGKKGSFFFPICSNNSAPIQ